MTILNLQDNKIEKIERRAFMNMNRLKYLNLRGNKMKAINDESFQNLPDLEFLDLAYNQLPEFDFTWFDQVGTLAALKVNASHNVMTRLKIDSSNYLQATSSKYKS